MGNPLRRPSQSTGTASGSTTSRMGSHCEVLRDSVADMMQPGGFNWASMRPQIESYRTWMHAEPVEAMFVHWDRCFPSFTQAFENLPESEKNTIDADSIRNLTPE